MKYLLVFLAVVGSALFQGCNCDNTINVRAAVGFLDPSFDMIISNIKGYVGSQKYGPNLVKVFEEIKKKLAAITWTDIWNDIVNGVVLNKMWLLVSDSAQTAFSDTPLKGAFITSLIQKARTKLDFYDVVHLIVGPYDGLFTKIQSAIDDAAKEAPISADALKNVKDLLAALETGIRSKTPK